MPQRRKQKSKQAAQSKAAAPRKAIAPRPVSRRQVTNDASNSLATQMMRVQGNVASRIGEIHLGGASSQGISGSSGNEYLDSLVDPSRAPVRIPDDYSRPTAVHQSFTYFTVKSGDDGCATVILNPILGDGATAQARNRWVTEESLQATVVTNTFNEDPDRVVLQTIGKSFRPTSASMLVSYVGDLNTNGGEIAAAWVPGDTSTVELNTILNATDIAGLAQFPGAYSGPLVDGVYVNWKSDTINDLNFQTPAKQLTHTYPLLVVKLISTQLNKDAIVRVSAFTNHEYTTNSKIPELRPSPVDPHLVTQAKRVLIAMNAACANDEHVTAWSRFLTGAGQFFNMVGQGIRSVFAPSLSAITHDAGQVMSNPGFQSAMNGLSAYKALGPAVAAV